MAGVDPNVIVAGHVDWNKLVSSDQTDLLSNYPPRQNGVSLVSLAPAVGITGDDVNPVFQAWLDSAYLARHSTDNDINNIYDPTDW